MTLRWLVCTSLLLAACTTELEPGDAPSEARHPLEGAWSLEAIQTDNTCPDLDLFGSVDVTRVVLARSDDSWRLDGPGASMSYTEVRPGLWLGDLEVPYQGCTLDIESRWEFEAVGPTSFAAWRRTSFRIHGDDCGYADEPCTTTHAVRGLR